MVAQATVIAVLLHLTEFYMLENVEHCGGEPEQAATGILCH